MPSVSLSLTRTRSGTRRSSGVWGIYSSELLLSGIVDERGVSVEG